MDDIYQLPIPDWGLRCPRCAHPLAGLRDHRCEACKLKLDMVNIIARHRPIPDVGLQCPECAYLLTGLTAERCPECGDRFSVRDLIENHMVPDFFIPAGKVSYTDGHVKRREPFYTGHERPLPDFGFYCAACREPLAGAQDESCPHCGEPFDVHAMKVVGGWVNLAPLMEEFPDRIRASAESVLYHAGVPFLVDNAGLTRALGYDLGLGRRGLRVPAEFVFDALAALAQANSELISEQAQAWMCPACGEEVPGGFEICWSCESPHPEVPDGVGDEFHE